MYRICPDCGAYLDPDERCDCQRRSIANIPIPTTTINPQLMRFLREQREKVLRGEV